MLNGGIWRWLTLDCIERDVPNHIRHSLFSKNEKPAQWELANKETEFAKIGTSDQLADPFTKALPFPALAKIRYLMFQHD